MNQYFERIDKYSRPAIIKDLGKILNNKSI